jgi:hypothetical protein
MFILKHQFRWELINNNRISLEVGRQEVMQVITIDLEIIEEKKEYKTLPVEKYWQ